MQIVSATFAVSSISALMSTPKHSAIGKHLLEGHEECQGKLDCLICKTASDVKQETDIKHPT